MGLREKNKRLEETENHAVTAWSKSEKSMIPYCTSTVPIECLTCDHSCFPPRISSQQQIPGTGQDPLEEEIKLLSPLKDVKPLSGQGEKTDGQLVGESSGENISKFSSGFLALICLCCDLLSLCDSDCVNYV